MVGHEPWTCVNPLQLANLRNPNKMVSLTIHFHQFFLILKNHVICVHYNLIGCWFTYLIFVVQTIKITTSLTCLFFQ